MTGRHCRAAAVVGALLVVATVVLFGCSSLPSSSSAPGLTAGSADAAPDFSGVTLDGLQVSLGGFRGKPLILAFTASWCDTCRAEAPEIARFYRDNKDRAKVLAMAVNDSEDAMRAFMSDGGWHFPVMLGADSAANAYGVRFLPTLVVIDAEGRIVDRTVGGATASDLSLLIDGLAR